ncbi:MAG: YraN family protein [Methylophaga sp.]|nr:MAG: YraN family protein [Methylophaga sp.]
MSNQQIGAQAELSALAYLEQYGLNLVRQNYHCRRGEIDLIMIDQDTLVFIEVRYRRSAKYGSALESVNHTKQSRIIHTAEFYLQQHPAEYSQYRFDVVAINPIKESINISWVKNAFQIN